MDVGYRQKDPEGRSEESYNKQSAHVLFLLGTLSQAEAPVAALDQGGLEPARAASRIKKMAGEQRLTPRLATRIFRRGWFDLPRRRSELILGVAAPGECGLEGLSGGPCQ